MLFEIINGMIKRFLYYTTYTLYHSVRRAVSDIGIGVELVINIFIDIIVVYYATQLIYVIVEALNTSMIKPYNY